MPLRSARVAAEHPLNTFDTDLTDKSMDKKLKNFFVVLFLEFFVRRSPVVVRVKSVPTVTATRQLAMKIKRAGPPLAALAWG